MSAAAVTTLLAPELAAIVSSFQCGTYADMKGFRTKLCPIYDCFYDAQLIRHRMPLTRAVLDPWLREHGVDRIPKAVRYCKKMRQVFVQYAVFYGDLALAMYLHQRFDLLSFREPLVDLAVLNGQLYMLQFLQLIGHPGQTPRALKWAVDGHHQAVVSYLVQSSHPPTTTTTTVTAVVSNSRYLPAIAMSSSNRPTKRQRSVILDQSPLASRMRVFHRNLPTIAINVT